MRKIVFLDVDGVLNDLHILSTGSEIGAEHLLNFKSLILSAKCEVVLSSSWRLVEDWKKTLKFVFQENNIPIWISETPELNNIEFGVVPRRNEILLWINENVKENAKVVILDDEWDADIKGHELKHIKDKFIHTSMNTGLTADHVNVALSFFKGKL